MHLCVILQDNSALVKAVLVVREKTDNKHYSGEQTRRTASQQQRGGLVGYLLVLTHFFVWLVINFASIFGIFFTDFYSILRALLLSFIIFLLFHQFPCCCAGAGVIISVKLLCHQNEIRQLDCHRWRRNQ